ncbi:MAG: MurR/RpiR family transcriptional regulator [Clostridiales bacterium]|nr:MurR/RpiR family transcriptional regulator [Candidatus Crickella merdequi]
MGRINNELNDRILSAELTASERQAVDFIINNVDNVVFLSASQVAELCKLSPTSITRVTQKLGYNKYSDFKKDIEELYREQIMPKDMFDSYLQSEIKSEIISQSLQRDYENLKIMEDNLDEDTLKAVAEHFSKAEKIFILGMFGSEIVAKSLDFYCWRLGKMHETFTGIGLSKKFTFSDVKPGDMVIAISSQRILKEIMESVEYANDNGVVTVAITDNYTNPLASKADYVLVAPVKGKVFDYTQTASLALVDILCNFIAGETQDIVRENLRESRVTKTDDLFCV